MLIKRYKRICKYCGRDFETDIPRADWCALPGCTKKIKMIKGGKKYAKIRRTKRNKDG
jgi:hypothetical protein